MKTSPNKKLALLTVFLVVLIDLMGFGIVLPLLPFYASQFSASPLAVGLLYSVYSFAQLIFSPLWGNWSDRIGRRPIMLMSTLGAASSYLLFSFSHSLGLLFISRLLAGIMGGNISAAQAYVADVTSPEDRAKGMGLIGAAFGIGFVLGPAISSVLIHPAVYEFLIKAGINEAAFLEQHRFAIPGLFACSLSFLSFLLVLFKLPESLDPASVQDPTRVRRLGIFSVKFWSSLAHPSSKLLAMFFLSTLLLSIGHSSLYSSFPLYCKKMLSLPAENVGLLFVWMGLVAVIIQGGLIRVLVKRYGEMRLFFVGNLFLVLGLSLIPFTRGTGQLTSVLCLIGIAGSLSGPTLTSLVSKSSKVSEMGSVLGSNQALSALGRVLGPAWGGWLFAFSPKAPFLLTALLVTGTVFIGWHVQKHEKGLPR